MQTMTPHLFSFTGEALNDIAQTYSEIRNHELTLVSVSDSAGMLLAMAQVCLLFFVIPLLILFYFLPLLILA